MPAHRAVLLLVPTLLLLAFPTTALATEAAPLWLAIPGLSASQSAALVDRFEVRGTHGDLTLGVGDWSTLAQLQQLHPQAFSIGEMRPSEAVYVIFLGPDEKLLGRPPARLLLEQEHLAIVAVPGDGSLPVADLLAADRRAFFHEGVARVSDRRRRPQSPRPDGLAAVPQFDPSVQGWVDQVNEANLESDVTLLSTNFSTRRSDTSGGLEAQDWIKGRYEALGLQTSLHSFDSGADNVVAEIPGDLEPEKVVIVGAHYDSLSFQGSTAPGADDNASGTAALLEIARILTSEGAGFRYTLRLVSFASEEFGLVGSNAYSGLMKAQGVDVVAMLNTDMNAYLQAGDILDLDMVTNNTTPWLNALVQDISHLYVPDLPTREGSLGGGSSDHQPFFNDGFPAVFYFEDTGDYSPFIHTGSDVVGTSANDFVLARKIVQAVLAGAAVLAEPVVADPAMVLTISGTCPGTVSMEVTGATPNASLFFLGASATGEFVVPKGSCKGTLVDLDRPRPMASKTADGEGALTISIRASLARCGVYLQVLDLTDCSATNVDQIP